MDGWKEHDPLLGPWMRLAAIREAEFALRSAAIIEAAATNSPPFNPVVLKALSTPPLQTLKEAADRYGALFLEADRKWAEASKQGAALLPDADWEAVRLVLYGP